MSVVNFKRVNYFNGKPLEIKDVKLDTANLKDDEILVKISHAALNPVDLILHHSSWAFFWKTNVKGIGRDYSGVVEQVGSKITEFVVGDQVSGLFEPIYTEQGTVSQYLIVKPSESPSGKIPKSLTLAEAASFPLVFATAYSTVRSFHKPTESSRVLVIGGATAVGYYTIQLLKNYYQVKSIVSINSSSSEPLVKEIGADLVVDYAKGNVGQAVKSIVDNEYQGEKFDLIIDCVGSSDIFPVVNDVLKPKTTESGFVTIVGDKIADYNQSMFKFFSWSLISKLIPYFRTYNYGFVTTCSDFYPLATKLFDEGKLKTYIDSEFELEDYTVAFKKLATHKARGKVLIKPN
ncbi:L-threonine 3-dehydrogenase [Wickerhamomyces ciferrii]|uniref:L-threonine 3-dehydrogenase n=1 Tax=Wickerhamomyces ciferrii (strain ATCC 14091 / BCRC 22168 / CBS 111 / JCM 3599 / NBRC 0793 / NRRL Y-1031 F-60-10) TaxID=1206466 RepID=K0KST9_WICCF|nr:L-threonine 3-dehydrogenase [Wickerhamomyces ciferrii]CCH45117.1 L-threonine 3-dehydrogenase [Wickerhamomyces ciferrii]